MNATELNNQDLKLLCDMGIEVFNPNRNYWLIRTQGGAYFDEFYFKNYIGIEWDDIIDISIKKLDDMILLVGKKYPHEPRPSYIASQIFKFIHGLKKGDIVLIPNKDSKIIAFGEIVEDEIYVSDDGIDNPLSKITLSEDEEPSIPVLRKRRKVNWIKHIPRENLDPYLQTFIYAHNTIVDLKSYSLFIDRTLSDFYIKGEDAYFTLRVNKQSNIPFDDLADLFVLNRSLCDFINLYLPEYHINRGEIVCKIDVQSKGPVQFTGSIKKITIIGLICSTLCGGKVSINWKDGFEMSTDGITKIVDSMVKAYDVIQTHAETRENMQMKQDYENLLTEYKKCQQHLELSAPDINTDITITNIGSN